MPDIIGLNKIFENKEQAIESFGELGERLISRSEDGKQVLARYYDEDGNVASLIGVYHYKRTGPYLDPYTHQERIADYGNIEIRDGNINNDCTQYLDSIVEELDRLAELVASASTALDELELQVDVCCPPEEVDYLTFTNVDSDNAKLLLHSFGTNNPNVYISYDNGETFDEWIYEPGNNEGVRTAIIEPGANVKIYGDNVDGFSEDTYNYSTFQCDKKVECSGNVMTLISTHNTYEIPNDECFYRLFYNMYLLLTPPDMPATSLTTGCYEEMYYLCKSLMYTPALPADIAKYMCYAYMFYGCDTLTSTCDFPATTLADECYSHMFEQCSRLVDVHPLRAEVMENYCYSAMFANCAVLEAPPELPAKFLAPHCYDSMFWGCVMLKGCPELRAETMKTYCYASMFYGCTRLESGTDLLARYLDTYCYYQMFENCSNLVILSYDSNELPSEELRNNCYQEMFKNCILLKKAPKMKPKGIAEYCCESMFYNCTNLSDANNVDLTNGMDVYERSYSQMFMNCSNLGSAIYTPATTLGYACYQSMYENCTSLSQERPLPARTLACSCYYAMYRNTAIKKAPDLPAERVPINPDYNAPDERCYAMMFNGCSSLSQIRCNLAYIDPSYANYAFNSWVDGVAADGFFYRRPEAANYWRYGNSSIPENWTISDWSA